MGLKAPRGKKRLWYYFHLNHKMAQKHGVALSKTFQDALDAIARSNAQLILCFGDLIFYVFLKRCRFK